MTLLGPLAQLVEHSAHNVHWRIGRGHDREAKDKTVEDPRSELWWLMDMRNRVCVGSNPTWPTGGDRCLGALEEAVTRLKG